VLASSKLTPSNARHEVARHPDHLGVVRALRAGAGDTIAPAKLPEPLADVDDKAGSRVPSGGAGR